MLDTLLSNYLDDYLITIIPYSEAEKLCGTIFSYKNALDKNFNTSEDTDEVFIQFKAENISNMFVVQLSAFFVNAFKNIGKYRNFGSMIPKLFRVRNGQYQSMSEINTNDNPLYYLNNEWGLRIYEGMKLMVELLQGSYKNKDATTSFIMYVRLVFNSIQPAYDEVDNFCKELRKKMKNKKKN